MIREVNLNEYLPPFIRAYKEIGNIMDAENPEFQMLVDKSEVIMNNQFIQSCDEIGIARFEKMLKITPTSDDTLESRISRVIVRWNETIPYTWKALLTKLNSLCGVGNYEVIPNFNEYELEIISHLDLYGQLNELENLLDYIIPANMVVNVDNQMIFDLECELNVGTVCSGTCEVEVTYVS